MEKYCLTQEEKDEHLEVCKKSMDAEDELRRWKVKTRGKMYYYGDAQPPSFFLRENECYVTREERDEHREIIDKIVRANNDYGRWKDKTEDKYGLRSKHYIYDDGFLRVVARQYRTRCSLLGLDEEEE